MIETLTNIGEIIVIVIGGATLVFRGLLILTQLTKTNKDDKIVSKILKVFEWLSLNAGQIKNVLVVKTK